MVHERLPSQAGVNFVNKSPNVIKSAAMPKPFKTCLVSALIFETFYSPDVLMTHTFRTHKRLTVDKSGLLN